MFTKTRSVSLCSLKSQDLTSICLESLLFLPFANKKESAQSCCVD